MRCSTSLLLLLAFGCDRKRQTTPTDFFADADADADADTDADSDSDTDADTDSDTDADTDSDTDADTDSDTDADTDADADPIDTADPGFSIVINEICADPGTANDANCDGTLDTTQDEFVEIVNNGTIPIDLSGATVSDSLAVKFTFPPGSVLPPDGAAVVFGGGAPVFDGTSLSSHPWCIALPATVSVYASSSLGLNNGGDSVILTGPLGTVLDSYAYGSEGGNDQSINRRPELQAVSMVQHSTIPGAIGAMSPGTLVDGQDFSNAGGGGHTGDTGLPPPVPAVVLNEVLADPAVAADPNCDGVGNTTQDEFVEIINARPAPLDLTGATLSDLTGVRHTFAPLVLGPGHAVVVFGGGTPNFTGAGLCAPPTTPVTFLTASSGALGLNNSGDTVTLADSVGTVIATMSYGAEGGQDHSLVLFREGDGQSGYIGHDAAAGSVGDFSPGRRANGQPF